MEALLTAQGRLRPGAQDFKEWVEEHPRWEGVERHGVYSGPLLSTEPGGKASQESGQRRWEPGCVAEKLSGCGVSEARISY